jgi:hypothetical protein
MFLVSLPLIDGSIPPSSRPSDLVARRAAIRAERERLSQLRRERKVSEETTCDVRRDLDLEEPRVSHTQLNPAVPARRTDEPDPPRTARRERQPAVAGLLDLLR